MKSKIFSVIFALAFSVTSFAGSITKTDSGEVSWTVNINKKQEGVLTFVKSGINVNGSNTISQEELRLATRIGLNSYVGGRKVIPMTFSFTDERSQESVESKIKEIVAPEIKDLPVEGNEAQVKLTNLSCKESGFLKKKLSCSAEFLHIQVLDIKL